MWREKTEEKGKERNKKKRQKGDEGGTEEYLSTLQQHLLSSPLGLQKGILFIKNPRGMLVHIMGLDMCPKGNWDS